MRYKNLRIFPRGGALAERGISGIFAGMSTLAEIEKAADQLQREEKLRLMESLWSGLSRAEAEVESPEWHGNVLAVTERRLAEGREEMLDWNRTKAELRDRTV